MARLSFTPSPTRTAAPLMGVAANPWLASEADTRLAAVLLAYGRHHFADLPAVTDLAAWPEEQQEALASEWSRGLCFQVLLGQLNGWILTGHHQGDWHLALDETLRATLVQTRGPTGQSADPWPLLACGLWPWFAALSRVAACRPRVLWSNAACYWHWYLSAEPLAQALAELTPAQREPAECRRQAAQAYVLAREWPAVAAADPVSRLIGRNPLYQPVRLRCRGGVSEPMRRICCQRHRLPGLGLCPSCPQALPGLEESHV
ncbi:(2Fe-2S)-binding protein [Pseudaeromonas paramecii]|uniref:Ferric siderophore reductase C-terminal domain-containing protein n=1 Tax=Pseudaeromonas paramecii TaxID=2138166 RepID=A0ABP8PYR2_9GAMM